MESACSIAAAVRRAMRAALFWSCVIASSAPVFADTVWPTLEGQRNAIVAVVETQLSAFRRDDAEAAFSVAAPSIQERFSTPGEFIAMVRRDYAPVYRQKSVRYLDLNVLGGAPVLHVHLIGVDGTRWQANYIMMKDGEQHWRIAGCRLMRLPGSAA